MAPHPLSSLSVAETNQAREVILGLYPNTVIDFRTIALQEPPKAEVVPFLALEHAGQLTESTPWPARLADLRYDVIGGKIPAYHESVVDLRTLKQVAHRVVGTEHHAGLTAPELVSIVDAIKAAPLFLERFREIELPDGFELIVEPWPYGGPDVHDGTTRFFQGLCFAADTRSNNPDANFYAFPLPLIPVYDVAKKEVVRIDEPATGGAGDPLITTTHKKGRILDHCRPAEYVPELLPGGTRQDLKPLTVVQPEGASFRVTDGNLVEWQKWRMRLTFNPREGAVLHDVCYDGRDVLYRLSVSEMTVPYADPRPPYHRKQAFDFGDGGLGHAANNLTLGCDCLGVIQYFDGVLIGADGTATPTKNVICLHEQDNGIGWKHTNWRTHRAVSTRRRELVFQFIITLANYEYIFAFKFDQAAGIEIETRATGIVSVVHMDAGAVPPNWGNVVSPGALAQNHQHVFCLRIDPAIDGHHNTLVQEESLPAVAANADTNPNGNYYEVRKTSIATSTALDLAPERHRVFKVQNTNKTNPVSGRPVGYKLEAPPTQLLLAHPDSIQAQRALFAQRHLWVTRYRDNELFAAGPYPLQSRREVGGVFDMAARADDVLDEDIVVWSVFGLTHNPRVEDWPVMPVEMIRVHFVPSDFFTGNPALDVPSEKDNGSKLANCCSKV